MFNNVALQVCLVPAPVLTLFTLVPLDFLFEQMVRLDVLFQIRILLSFVRTLVTFVPLDVLLV